MIGLYFSLVSVLSSLVLVILLVVQYYQARVDAAREEAEMWKRKAGRADQAE